METKYYDLLKNNKINEFNKLREKEVLDLSNANLENANLENANLYNANLRNAYLKGANLYNANLENANLENANLENANLRNAYLKNANLRYAYLENANLRYANLGNANLYHTKLTDVITVDKYIVSLSGIYYHVIIFDKAVNIGCKVFSIDEIKSMTREKAFEIDKEDAIDFFDKYYSIILGLIN